MDSGFMRALAVVWDLIVLNLIFLICCIPLVTIGASLTALHYVTLKMAAGDGDFSVLSGFFQSFRQNFRQATALWLLFAAAGGFLGYDVYLLWRSEELSGGIFAVLILIVAAVYIMTLLYVFPLLSRFHNTVTGAIRNAFVISVTSFFRTFSMLLLIAACAALTVYTWTTVRYGLFFWFALGFSSVAFANSFVFNRVFPKYSREYAKVQEQAADGESGREA